MEALLFRHHVDSAAQVRQALSAELTAARVCEHQIFDTLLVAAELIGNALSHARPLPDGNLRVRWDLRDSRARIEVHDGGSPTVPTVRCDGPARPEARGLAIVDAIADSWGYESGNGCCIVWAELILKPAP